DNGSNPEIITRTYSVTDICENSINVTQTITVNDTTNPTITCPSNVSVNVDAGSCEASSVNLGTPITDDNCSVDTVTNDAPTIFPLGDTIVTWTVTDIAGNSAICTQTVTVVDDAAPTIACPIDVTVNVDAGLCTATNVDLGTPNASDCTAVTYSNDAPSVFPQGDTIVEWTVTDLAGNSVTCTQVVTVIDNINPTFVEALPADTTVECSEIPEAEVLTATDNCGSAEVTFGEERIDGSCASNFTLVRTWTATDTSGLTTIHTQNITVQDTTRPEFVEDLPEDITVECDAVPNASTLTATDNCGDASVSLSDVITPGNCANNYTITRTWIATDACGLITSHVQIITVQDTTAPVPTTTFDEELDVSCADVPDAPALEFSDNCSTTAGITVVFEETNTFDENVLVDYQIIRTWTVTDECANQETYTQTLNVSLDEVLLDVVAPDLCFDEGAVDLNNFTPDTLNTNGTWELLEGGTGVTLTDNIFDPTNIEWDSNTVQTGINHKFRYTTTDQGCISITDIDVTVNYCTVLPCGENDIVISKAITPNGDLINDFFYISGIDLCGFTANIKIFNRWGALVFESNQYPLIPTIKPKDKLLPPGGSWLGNSPKSSIGNKGKLPNGTYYYIINLENSGLKPLTGPIYLGTK
ncbi:HYR-like domain-containing protein, partial [Gelatiniphilus marinus]